MSSSTAAPREAKQRKGVDKVLYRVKTVFHRKGSSSRKGTSSAAPAAAPASIIQPPAPPAKKLPEYEGATRIPRIQIHEERAKKLGARFGLEIKPSEWHSSEGEVLRVDKPVRMRIHRECHRCKSRFGAGNQTEAERQANRERREALIQKHKDMAPIIPSYDYSPQAQQIVLTRPRKVGAQDLVYKGRPRMRCGHKRCADCPRFPDNKKSYPYGYPNDEPGSKFKGVFACHECKTKFDPQAEDGTQCSKCAHEKCSECRRVKPRRVEPEPDPDVLESLRLRMAALETSDS
ncbi:hypothetical protein GQX73_g2522 [Xylaria multiplex]|uniref:Uncharacterized protein n=1 Tax=Xylaria multiplex TaxID=323545 RepID=A0A7C8MV07_9PEZI|nr:hypothetical protein GQX73_g2522 [Xylaria multiplex]